MEVVMTQPLVWVTAVVIFCVGVLVGVALRPSQEKERAKELETSLQESRQALVEYRSHVTEHFVHTADLLHAMTANYRAVYEHLANGAQSLCDGQVQTLTAATLRERLLPTESPDQTAAEPPPALPLVPDETVLSQHAPLAEVSAPESSNTHGEEQREGT